MDLVTSNYLPGDPRLIDQIVYELKSQGIFDQFRKECIADVDTKPAYQNLSQRVEGSVMNFLKKQTFSEDMNKNQLREQLRKNISESGFLETGVERIVDQVVNPKINTIFLPKVEDVVYRFLGIENPSEKPIQQPKQEFKVDVEDLLPNDLEAISPESVPENSFNSNSEKKDESIETNENSLNSSNTKTEDESPPFELLEENTKFSMHEENSVDSHLSGILGLASHESGHSIGVKNENLMDITQDISQNSLNSEGNLSIITSEEDTKMEICEDSNLIENKDIKKENSSSSANEIIGDKMRDGEKDEGKDETEVKEKAEKIEERAEEVRTVNEIKIVDKKDGKKSEDKKAHEGSKKSHDKYKSSRGDKNRKDDKEKRSKSKSDSKSKDHKDSKSHSKHTSSSKDKEKDKDKKDYTNGKDKEGSEKDKVTKEQKERDKSNDKNNKNKEKSEKDRDKSEKDKGKVGKDKEKSDKEKISKDKSDRVKEKLDREKSRSEKEKNKSVRDKDKVDKDKSNKDKSDKERSSSSKYSQDKSSSSKKEGSSKEKDKSEDKSCRDKSSLNKDKIVSSSSKHKESSSKDKDSSKTSKDKEHSKSSSLSSSKDKEKKGCGDSKSKSSDKHKKNKSSHHDKSSSIKKDKDRKTVDDHYSLKDKKTERRSTDRDSNDGSSKVSRNGSFTESYAQSFKGSSKESSEVFSSGSGDSSNSDNVEENTIDKASEVENVNEVKVEALQTIKYMKPKFASNIHEAMKIMKIRKQLAKLERENQLSLTPVAVVKSSQTEPKPEANLRGLSIVIEKTSLKSGSAEDSLKSEEKIKLSIESKSDKQESVLSEKQQIQNKLPAIKIISNNIVESETLKAETLNSETLITEETPMLKSQDLSMETFEALEARLAEEMLNVNYHMYGEEEDNYEYTSIAFSPVKKRKASDEPNPYIKKINFDALRANADGDNEIELVVNNYVKEEIEQITEPKEVDVINDTVNVPVFDANIHVECNCDITEQIVPSKDTDVLRLESSNIIIENGEELVLDGHEECVDYIQESVINNVLDHDNSDAIFANKKEEAEATVDPIPEIETEDIYEKHAILENDYHNDLEKTKLNDDHDEFRGFDVIDQDNTRVIKFSEKISELKNTLVKLNDNKPSAKINQFPAIHTIEKENSVQKEDRIILKHGLCIEATLKEVTNIPSTIQDLLQKNGKKLFIKIDKLECELPSKVLVALQGMENKGIMNSPVCDVNNGRHKEVNHKQMIQRVNIEAEETLVCRKEETKQKDQICNELSSTRNKQEVCNKDDFKWEDDDNPCYYFDKSNSISGKQLKILNNAIGRLERTIEEQSLQIQNNIPSAKQRGRKRKVQSTENNNSISAQWKPEAKRKHLLHQNGENMCNTNVPQNQGFSLPLSPAESEKSYEHKKEEPVTVKTKRTGRVLNSKRYSSEDLYKPRPVLSCGSTRRRGLKSENT